MYKRIILNNIRYRYIKHALIRLCRGLYMKRYFLYQQLLLLRHGYFGKSMNIKFIIFFLLGFGVYIFFFSVEFLLYISRLIRICSKKKIEGKKCRLLFVSVRTLYNVERKKYINVSLINSQVYKTVKQYVSLDSADIIICFRVNLCFSTLSQKLFWPFFSLTNIQQAYNMEQQKAT